ncbi:hypothetical protein ACH5RR_025513 [Cinchona calisaya]|uniref:Apyrase 7 n=1 Tax=Cinchona calisaya TaxID=153742 RepID=A0ABD2YZV3_9GENT
MEPKSPSKSKLQVIGSNQNCRILKIGATLLIILSLVLAGGVFLFKPDIFHSVSERDSYYTVVLDCGSTGTRVNVYRWMVENGVSKGNLPVLLEGYPGNLAKSDGCQYHCMQSEPGLDKFVGNASGVRASLEPLIRLAEQWVPLEKHGVTPIFVLATAGMRRLASKDARQVLEDVEDVVKKYRFLYRKDWIRVLSGKEEAYYGWVSLNYKMGVLGNLSRLPSLGLLDLGGSSLQVVTEVDESREDEHLLISVIGSIEHQLLAYSLPAFGLNEAFDRSVVMLTHTEALRESGAGMFEVRHPCLSSSYLQNYTCHGCFGLDRTNFGNITGEMEEKQLSSILLTGSSNWEQCKVLARATAVNSSTPQLSRLEDHSNCTGLSSPAGSIMLNLTSNSLLIRHYNALSGFFAISNRLNLSGTANLTKLWETGQHLCPRLWADQTSTSGHDCFRVPYMASLLEDALCLRNVEIIFGPGDISWTSGAALIEGDYMWLGTAQSAKGNFGPRNHRIISSPIILFIFLSFLLFIVHCKRIKLPMPGRKVSSARTRLPSYLCPKRQPV